MTVNVLSSTFVRPVVVRVPETKPGPVKLGPYTFKVAESEDEIEQVHRLNYATFVREIPQHADNGAGRLVDKYHDKNLYVVAKRGGRVVGMITAHGQKPFSVEEKLSDPAVLKALGDKLLEVRLLAVEPAERSTMVFAGLSWFLHRHAQKSGYTHLVISGIRDRQRLYERIGFSPMGPAVRSGDAWFVPMMKHVGGEHESIAELIQRFEARVRDRVRRRRLVRLTPGPVAVSQEVRRAYKSPPVGHRTTAFVTLFEEVRRGLRELTGGGSDVALLCGSGTLANDAVAANLAADTNLKGGLILVNGEFGERLSQHAARAGLNCRTLVWDWGRPWDLGAVDAALKASPDVNWVWGVHLESSTGVLNDLRGLVRVTNSHGARVCIDCMSSLGGAPIDLSGVHMASGASGKSLGSYAGLAIVMASPGSLSGVKRDKVIPSLDVASAIDARGPRFTFASAPVVALREALRSFETETLRTERFERYARLGQTVRAGLREAGIEPIAPDSIAAPVITSFVCPRHMGSAAFVTLCRKWGFDVAGLSRYLERRGWSQIATMGPVRESDVRRFLATLGRWMATH